MKTAFLALLFFLFAFATADFVLDIDGKPVLNGGGQYYILPVFRGRGGGLTLARVGKETCPRTVVQASSELSNGLPVTFSSPLRILFINTGMYLNIEFKEGPTCTPKPSLWHISEDSELEGSVKIGGNQRFQGEFQIQKASKDGYKLLHCPTSTDSCRDLGIAFDEEKNRCLVVRDGNPLIVQFKEATQSSEKWSIV